MIADLTNALCSLSPWPRFRASTSTTSSPAQWFIDWMHGGSSTDSGIEINAEKALSYAPVYQAVSILAGDVGQLPMDLYQREGERNKEKAKTRPGYRLMRRRANDYMSAGTFRETLMYYALFWGNGCAEIERDNAGRPSNLWPLLPDRTSMVVENGKPWYLTRAGEREFRLRPQDVLHIRNFGFDGLWGYSTLTLARNSWALGLAGAKYAGTYFKNNGLPSGVLEHPTAMTDPAYNKLKRDWREAHEGLDNSARVAILEEGTKFTPTAFNHKDAQWIEGRKFSREEVAAWFGLPPHKIGAMEHATFSNIEEQNRDYLNTGLMRWLVKWQEECDEKLLPERVKRADSHFFEFNTAALLRGDLKSRYEAYAIGTQNAWLNPNEVRAAENMNAYEGGDEFRSQMNMEPASGADDEPDDDDDTDNEAVDEVVARINDRVNVEMANVGKVMAVFGDDVEEVVKTSLAKFETDLTTTGDKAFGVVEADIAEEMGQFRESLNLACAESVQDHAAKMTDVGLLSLEAFTQDAGKVVDGLMHDTVGRATVAAMLAREVNRVMHAARTSKNFCGFLDRFYDDWPSKVAERLGEYTDDDNLFVEWARESKDACLEVAGRVTDRASLEESISPVVTAWPKRAEGLAAGILRDNRTGG